MTSSVYDALSDCIGKSFDEIKLIIDSLAIDFFTPFWTIKKDTEDIPIEPDFTYKELPAVINYIIHAYSRQSKMLILGSEFISEKKRIAEKVGVPEYLHGKVLKLKSAIFRDVVLKYLDYQGSRAFKSLQTKKDMFERFDDSSFNMLFTDGLEIDSKAIKQIQQSKDDLLQEIKDCEDKLRSEFNFIYTNQEDAQKAAADGLKNNLDNGNIENSKWVNYKKPTNESIS